MSVHRHIFIRETVYDSCDLTVDQAVSARRLRRRFASRARLQRCVDSAAAQIDVIHIVVELSESTILCVPSFACFATVSSR